MKKTKKATPKTYIVKGRMLNGRKKAKRAATARRRRRAPKRRGFAGLGSAQNSNIIMIVVLVLLTGGLYLGWEWWKRMANEKAGIMPLDESSKTPTLPAPPALPQKAFEEVSNSFFAENPFAYVDADKLNIREYPSENAKVIYVANKGQYLGRHTGKSTDIDFPHAAAMG